MAEMDIKAKALSDARDRILRLQEQMTDRVLQMAAEVEKLMAVVTPSEAHSFLKARCNLPAVELSTYVGFAKTLKGAEDVLASGRVSFPVVKALVSADAETREDVLARIAAGAQIDTRDVSAIRKRLREAKLTPAESLAAHNRKLVAAAARKRAVASVESFEEKISAFVDTVRKLPPEQPTVPNGVRSHATALLQEFESLFGANHPPLHQLKQNSPGYQVGRAHHALRRFRDDNFRNAFGFGLKDSDNAGSRQARRAPWRPLQGLHQVRPP